MLYPRKLTEEEAAFMRARAESVVSEFEGRMNRELEALPEKDRLRYVTWTYAKKLRNVQRDLEYLRIVHSEEAR